MRTVDTLAQVVVGRAALLAAIDLGVGRVEIDGRALRDEIHPALLRHQREGLRDERRVGLFHLGTCRLVEALPQADHRRGRRHVCHSTQAEAGNVFSLVVEIAREVTTREHRLGQNNHHPTEHQAPTALLERRSPGVDRRPDTEQPVDLRHQVETSPRSDPTIRSTQHHLAMLLRYPHHQTGAFHLGSWGRKQPPLSQVTGTLSRTERVFARTYSPM